LTQAVAKQLVIVESPAKAKTIGKFLGKGFAVKASMGHVRDLPKSGLGIDVEQDFETEWQEIGDRAKVLTDLRKRAQDADTVYLATDPDREGEAIAWHLAESLTEALGPDQLEFKRVVFHEITDSAIHEAFEQPGDLNGHAVDAYRARRILDRLMGYKLSPLLWKKLSRGLSAGRVQSVAVRLVVEREREIRAFVPDEYWKSEARFGAEDSFSAAFKRLDGNKLELKTSKDARSVLSAVAGSEVPDATASEEGGLELLPLTDAGPFTVSHVESKDKLDRARPPFITSTLQQAASSAHGFAAKRTMRTAQQLYEGMEVPGQGLVGLITYMRTDSFNISNLARGAAASFIEQAYGKPYLPAKPNAFRSKKGAQEAHEAIRPTDPARTPESLRGTLKPDQMKLYELIWRRFMSSQMAPAQYQVTTVELTCRKAAFEASGRVTIFDGHTRVYGRDSGDQQLPAMTVGAELTASEVGASQHFTSPPRRYTEASLVRSLEKHGIGRPSTYASILSVIVDRGYVDHGEEAADEEVRSRMLAGVKDPVAVEPAEVSEDGEDGEAPAEFGPRQRKSKAFYATHLGEVVTDLLLPWFGNVIDTEFTARMEGQLDAIAEGQLPWRKVIEDFYTPFANDLDKAEDGMSPYWEKPLLVDEMPCGKVPEDGGPACTAPMAILFNRFGPYLGCSRYPDCKNTVSLTGMPKPEAVLTEHTCRDKNDKGAVCGRRMHKKVNRWGKPFLACSGFATKDCKGSVSLSVNDVPLWPVDTSVKCPDCEALLQVKRSKRGKFLACPRFPKCRGTRNLPNCPHTSRTGKLCGKPMTEPAAAGSMACKTHPDVTAVPPERKKDADDAAPKKKAAKRTTRKKTTRKKATKKTAAAKAAPPPKAAK